LPVGSGGKAETPRQDTGAGNPQGDAFEPGSAGPKSAAQ
jgi:hypothetical protein